ncbi:hypothetical protein SprV_0301316900 [Sparganum proliferum]
MEEQPIASTSSVANESPELQMPELMPEVSTELPVVAGTVDTVEGRCLTTDLREFCLRAKLSLTTAKDLFQVLRHYHPELPNDPRTLLQTPRTCVSKSLKRGKYVHLGLERGLLDELRLRALTGIPEVHVQLHIDGMKVFKASAQCLWPILARVNHLVVGQPFVVGVFCGFGKPEPLEDFLGDCVSELKGLLTTGLRDPRTESVIKVNLLNVICDTPARCYVGQVKAHNGYYGCDRHIRKLSSDSYDEDSPHQPTEPTGWPAPPPILQKRNDFLAEQLMALNSSVQQMQATLSDVVNALQRASSAGSVTSSSLSLPLCTEEAYENFLRRLSVEDGFANEALLAIMTANPAEFYTFSAENIDGEMVSMERYKGKVCLVVNVATKCGLTDKNYAQLQQLYTTYADQGLHILAFPCNQFAHQEPGTNAEIKENTTDKYHTTFEFFSKCDVNGSNALPLFKYLQNALPGTLINSIKWNFTKFLIGRDGTPYKRYSPQTDPMSVEVDVKHLLAST